MIGRECIRSGKMLIMLLQRCDVIARGRNMIYLPDEIILQIFTYLSFMDGLKAAKVNHQWRCAAYDIVKKWPLIINQDSLSDRSLDFPSKGQASSIRYFYSIRTWLNSVSELDCSAAISCPIKDLSSYCPNLKTLNISGLESISEACLNCIITDCPLIEHLDVSNCYHFAPSTLILIADNLQNLKSINISRTQLANISSITHFIKQKSKSLVKLQMRQCVLLSELDWVMFLDTISNYSSKISHLDISFNCLFTDDALIKLCICSNLELDVRNCDQLSIRCVRDTMKRYHPYLVMYQNARIPDYTPEGIRSYIQYLIGQ